MATTHSGLASYCRPCKRNRFFIDRYGITALEFDRMVEGQGSACGICREVKPPSDLVVDHDHTTGRVRGLLCNSCNTGIGLLREDPKILSSAIDYVTAPLVA
ncbi:endonuclease VII [Gordonia phage Mollymur]|uniref:Endonuclease VII n=1 Tax=Gordonia phage Mollymur TaxID=2590895 RepID=A0A4Y6E9N8_9CAUD|nr:endonuclease VII [Gordonia phage Mollymur]QDF15385.1 endonuclease VII [Gordonia phage Mollymur]